MELTSLLSGAAQTTGNKVPPILERIGEIGMRTTDSRISFQYIDGYKSSATCFVSQPDIIL